MTREPFLTTLCVSDFVSVSAVTTLFHQSIILIYFFRTFSRMIITFTCLFYASTWTFFPPVVI
ncbi:hypothetical protein BC827DRAFT_1217075, partial [Russula dissimulans]